MIGSSDKTKIFAPTPRIVGLGILFIITLMNFYCNTPVFEETRTITIQVQAVTLPADAKIYIAGNLALLGNWDPNVVPLIRQADGNWSKSFSFKTGTVVEFKITRGSWYTEALDSAGIEFPNFMLPVEQDTTLTISIPHWRDLYHGHTIISLNRLQNKGGQIELLENWRFHPGDDPSWSQPDLDDSTWPIVDPRLMSDEFSASEWPGIGWFRLRLSVDSSLWHVPLALLCRQAGASDVYLNGRLVHRFGIVSAEKSAEKHLDEKNPRYFRFDSVKDQVIAVRYSNHQLAQFQAFGILSGFEITIGAADLFSDGRIYTIRRITIQQFLFSVIPVTLAWLHLLLFFFYPGFRQNLYYGICMIGFATLSFLNFQQFVTISFEQSIWLNKIGFLAGNLAIVFGLLTTYARRQQKIPRQFYLIVSLALLLTAMNWLRPDLVISRYFNLFLILAALELLRIIILPFFKKEPGEWIIGTGLFLLMAAITLQILIDTETIRPIFGIRLVYVYGVLGLSLAMSIDLALDFARTNERLLQQERQAREQELARRLLEADNLRKTQELEEARALQLAMLPEKVPQLPNIDIAVFMNTATEVGGDYYDFITETDALTVAVGDATGHGIKAGIMVTLMKSLFNNMGTAFYLPDFFKHCTRIIKQMNLGNLYMALLLLRIKGNQMVVASAGMPPILYFNSKTQAVEEILLKGMPLGTLDFPYSQKKIQLSPGDTLLLMSDGLPELFNQQMETLDYPMIKQTFARAATGSPEEIINALNELANQWSNNRPPNDDITFVVLKIKHI